MKYNGFSMRTIYILQRLFGECKLRNMFLFCFFGWKTWQEITFFTFLWFQITFFFTGPTSVSIYGSICSIFDCQRCFCISAFYLFQYNIKIVCFDGCGWLLQKVLSDLRCLSLFFSFCSGFCHQIRCFFAFFLYIWLN